VLHYYFGNSRHGLRVLYTRMYIQSQRWSGAIPEHQCIIKSVLLTDCVRGLLTRPLNVTVGFANSTKELPIYHIPMEHQTRRKALFCYVSCGEYYRPLKVSPHRSTPRSNPCFPLNCREQLCLEHIRQFSSTHPSIYIGKSSIYPLDALLLSINKFILCA
jgi:hypothetical protein